MKRHALLSLSFAFATAVLAPSLAFADEPNAPLPSSQPQPQTTQTPTPIGPPAATTTTPTPATPAATPPSPVVELSADDGRATIERRLATTSPTVPLLETGVLSMGHWEHACVAPCQTRLDSRYVYRVAGDGLVPTDSFALPRGQDHVRVDAKMGSSTGRVLGVLGVAGGALALLGGGLALAASPILAADDVGSKGFRTAVLASGVGLASVGVISATVGLFLWLSNGSSAHTEPTYAPSNTARR